MASALDLMGPGILQGLDDFGASLVQGFMQRNKIREARQSAADKKAAEARQAAAEAARRSRMDLSGLIEDLRPEYTVKAQELDPTSPAYAQRFQEARNRALLAQAQAQGIAETDPAKIAEALEEAGQQLNVSPAQLRALASRGDEPVDNFREQAFAQELRRRAEVLGVPAELVDAYLGRMIDVPSSPSYGVPQPAPTQRTPPQWSGSGSLGQVAGTAINQAFSDFLAANGQPAAAQAPMAAPAAQDPYAQNRVPLPNPVGVPNNQNPLLTVLPGDEEIATLQFPPTPGANSVLMTNAPSYLDRPAGGGIFDGLENIQPRPGDLDALTRVLLGR